MRKARVTVGRLMIAIVIAALATWLSIGLCNIYHFSNMAKKHDTAVILKAEELDMMSYFYRKKFRMPQGLTAAQRSARWARFVEMVEPLELTDDQRSRKEQLKRELDYERKMLSWCQEIIKHPWRHIPPSPRTPTAKPEAAP